MVGNLFYGQHHELDRVCHRITRLHANTFLLTCEALLFRQRYPHHAGAPVGGAPAVRAGGQAGA